MKRILMMIALWLMVLWMAGTVSAAEIVDTSTFGENNQFTWELDSEGTMTISGQGEMEDFLRYTTDSNGDTVIFRYWNSCMKKVKRVVIEEGITYVGGNAFSDAEILTEVVLADSVQHLGYRAFANCDKLTQIHFGGGLVETDIEVFLDCDNLTAIILPDYDVDYGRGIFRDCDRLKTVALPEELTRISESMFAECKSLAQIKLPVSVNQIGGRAFEFCSNLKEVIVPEGVKKIETNTFAFCEKLASVSLPNSLEEMGNTVFENCLALKKVTVPANVKEMAHTFECAYGLKEVTFLGDVPSHGSNLFGNITVKVYYPGGNPTWTADACQDYGGSVTWIAVVTYGDVNGNGTVNAKDAMLVLQYYTKKIEESKLYLPACDVDGNKAVNAKDAMLILQFYTKKMTKFPIEKA